MVMPVIAAALKAAPTIAAAATTASSMSGGGQGGFGQPAPPVQLGGPRLPEFGGGPKTSLPAMGLLASANPSLFADNGLPLSAMKLMQDNDIVPDWFRQGSTPTAETPEKDQNFLQSFLGNLDNNLQRPSMGLGLGLLGQASPYLPYAGLLAMGLLDPKKLGGE